MPKIEQPKAEDMSDERYFQIRDCDRRGCGSFYYFTVTRETPISEIMTIAADEHTDIMANKEENHYPSPFVKPPYWRPTLKVVELKRAVYKLDPLKDTAKMKRTGSDFGSNWTTLRGGLKFAIELRHMRIKTNMRTISHKQYTVKEIDDAENNE